MKEKQKKFTIQVKRNTEGKQFETQGEINEAIELYEKNIAENFEGNYPYDRLAVIYRRQNLINEEIRVLSKAIWVFRYVVYEKRQDRIPKLNNFEARLQKIWDESVICTYCKNKTPYYGSFCQECGKPIITSRIFDNEQIIKLNEIGHFTIVNVDVKKIESSKKGKIKYLLENEDLFAEEIAVRYYENNGFNASWTENYYWWFLMALLFWDVIFAPLSGVFNSFKLFTRMNDMPNDFFKPEFYQRRQTLIENRITKLENSNIEREISKSYKRNYGKKCRPIEDWNRYTLNELLIPAKYMDKNNFLKLLKRLIIDFNNNRSGLPDLIVYDDNKFFFSEVKSENDRVSKNQRKWHLFLLNHVKLKFDLFIINHSERRINNIKSSYGSSTKN